MLNGNVQVNNATINVKGTDVDNLLQRVELLIEDCDFIGALQKCNTILDSNPMNGKAYFFMLMSILKCCSRDELGKQIWPYDKLPYYIKAMQYGDDKLKSELQKYNNVTHANLRDLQNNLQMGSTINFGRLENEQKLQRNSKTLPLCYVLSKVSKNSL